MEAIEITLIVIWMFVIASLFAVCLFYLHRLAEWVIDNVLSWYIKILKTIRNK